MAKSNDFGVGLMHEAAITASRVGWEPEDIANLSKDENLLRLIRGVLLGTHEIKGIEYFIDCDSAAFTPEGWKVEEHIRGGNIRFIASEIELYISLQQKNKSIDGYKLRDELKDKNVLNANVLDYLLANPKAIPESWKDKAVFFWGTIYREPGGRRCVRCLYWCDGQWRWSHDRLVAGWGRNNPAAILNK